MRFRSRLEKLPGPSAVAIGNFDGFHAGHRRILATLQAAARRRKLLAVTLTFHPHPRLFFNQPVQLISTDAQRREILSRQPLDYLFFIDFSIVAAIPARDFVRDFLLGTLGMKLLVVGEDFRFGRGREGDLAFLEERAAADRFAVIRSPSVEIDNSRVTSSLIRKKLAAGAVREANRMLERPYYIDGTVARGAGRGSALGFPTINTATDNLLLPSGIFHTLIDIGKRQYDSLTYIGSSPTFAAAPASLLKVETHIPGFRRSVYGKKVRVHFLDRIRAEKKFASTQELVEQIRQDISLAGI